MSSLLDSVRNSIIPELTTSLATHCGIPADSVNSALQTSSAVILSTAAGKAHDATFLSSIYELITGSEVATAAASTSAAESETVAGFLSTLFGSHLSNVESKIAETSHIPLAAGGSILASAASLVIGALADKINAGELSLAALGGILTAELYTLKSHLPAGLVIPGVAGLETVGYGAAPTRRAAAQEARSSAGWLWPVLLLGAFLIAGVVWYFSQGKQPVTDTATQATTAAADSASKAGDAPQNAVASLGAFFKRKLPNGTELNIPENGIENKLSAFIDDSSKPADKETWFDFDRLLFATGSATLESSSNEQLQNVAAILKAYPNVHLRIGGYTDNTGNSAANVRLSKDRASHVMASLVEQGVAAARLDARGYSEEHPVADNATEAGRARNRRISVRVTKK